MNRLVFDSSAILAIYYNEPGKNKARSLLDGAESFISAVNLSEVFTKLLQDKLGAERISESFNALDIEVIEFGSSLAMKAAELRSVTKHLGLSFGDRACLALALQENAAAITADRMWSKLDLCPIEVIR